MLQPRRLQSENKPIAVYFCLLELDYTVQVYVVFGY
jgi:hypothetical protein